MTHAERERLFLDLMAAHKRRIERICYGYLGSAGDLEDAYQEIMINVWNSLPGFRGASQASTWLFRIAVNTVLIHRRKRRPTEPLPELPDGARGAHRDLEEAERLEALRAAIGSLPDQDRLIVTLLLEGLSYKEIADVTGITVSHVGVKINRIKQVLEEKMTEVFHGAF
jgi:RNA polymerase sigma-70 factor (ECF subfamily)